MASKSNSGPQEQPQPGPDSRKPEKLTELREEHFRLAQAAGQMATWEWDPDTGKSKLSAEMYHIFGTDPSDADHLGAWTKNVHPDDMARMPAQFEQANRTGIMEFEYRYRHPVKGLRWFYCKGARIRAENTMFGIVMDITDRKRAEDASQRLAAIVQSSDDAIISKDMNGIITSWNPGAEKMFGYKPEEIIGTPITTIIPPELQSDEKVILARIRRGERVDHFETTRLTKAGEQVEVSLTVSPIKDEAGRVIGAAKIARDVGQRKKAEEALRTSEKLASVGRLAATVAHEINNPLAAVVNLIYLIKKDPGLPAGVKKYVTMAEEELGRIGSLTRQTLGFYREERGAVPVRLGELSQAIVTVFLPKAANKSIHLSLQVRSDPEIQAFKGELRQLIANLLGNSIDAVPQNGSIALRVRAEKAGNRRGGGVRLTIADSGPGIPDALRTRIFEPFFTTKQDVGTGLGLWICKNIVEKHKGSLRLRSSTTPGHSWTVFSIFLPAEAASTEEINARSLQASQSAVT